jgi:hypothetical protein
MYATMQKVRKTKDGYEVLLKISSVGLVTIPARIKEILGKKSGDEIKIMIPENQKW